MAACGRTPPIIVASFASEAIEHCRAAIAQLAEISEVVEDPDVLVAMTRQADALEQVIAQVIGLFGLRDARQGRSGGLPTGLMH